MVRPVVALPEPSTAESPAPREVPTASVMTFPVLPALAGLRRPRRRPRLDFFWSLTGASQLYLVSAHSLLSLALVCSTSDVGHVDVLLRQSRTRPDGTGGHPRHRLRS